MTNCQTPPGRTSISRMVLRKPRGPHHCATWCGSVHTFQTSSRGASNNRDATISRSAVFPVASGLFIVIVVMELLVFGRPFLFLQNLKIAVEAIETLLPEAAVFFEPVGGLLHP